MKKLIPHILRSLGVVGLLFLAFTSIINAKVEDEDIEQLKEGNLALPSSQQISPLFGFGQNIIDKDVVQLESYFSYLRGRNRNFKSVVPALLYGITDDFSVFMNFPVNNIESKTDNNKASGLGDIFLQFEYAIYNSSKLRSSNQITIVADVFFPTGNSNILPSLGVGSPSFFLGTTASHLAIDWYLFASFGASFTIKKNNNKLGDQFLYQFGIGRNIAAVPDKWMVSFILEFNGIYFCKDKVNNQINLDSGGNVFAIAPTLWFSSEHWILQAGIAFPVAQHLFGNQNTDSYWLALNVGYTF